MMKQNKSRMSRKIILILFILTYSLSYAQYDWTPGKLLLKNGETLKGLFKLPLVSGDLISISNTKLEYKEDRKGKKIKFDETQIDKVFFVTFNPDLGYYEYVPISNNKMGLFKLIRNGKVKLYARMVKVTVRTGVQNSNSHFSPFGDTMEKKREKVIEYYMIRANETVATRVFLETDGVATAYDRNIKNFKKDTKHYFSDCPDVLSYIEDDFYDDFDIAQIVEDYNLLCE